MSDVSRLRCRRANPNLSAKTEQVIKMGPSYTMTSGVATSGWIMQFETVTYNRGWVLHQPGPQRSPSMSSLYTGLGHAVIYVKFVNGEIHDISWNSAGLMYDRYPCERTKQGKFCEAKALRFCPELASAGFVLGGQTLSQPFHIAALWGAAVGHDATVMHRMGNYKSGTNCLAFCLKMEDVLLSGTFINPTHARHHCHGTEWSTRGDADMCKNPLCESRSAAPDAETAAPQPLAFSDLAQQQRPSLESTNTTAQRIPTCTLIRNCQRIPTSTLIRNDDRRMARLSPWCNTRSRTRKRARCQEEDSRPEDPKLQDQEATSVASLPACVSVPSTASSEAPAPAVVPALRSRTRRLLRPRRLLLPAL